MKIILLLLIDELEKKHKSDIIICLDTSHFFSIKLIKEKQIYINLITKQETQWMPIQSITKKNIDKDFNVSANLQKNISILAGYKQLAIGKTSEITRDIVRVNTEEEENKYSLKTDKKGIIIKADAENHWKVNGTLYRKQSEDYQGNIAKILLSIETIISEMDNRTKKKTTIENIIKTIYEDKAIPQAKKNDVAKLLIINKELQSRSNSQLVRLKQNKDEPIKKKNKMRRKLIIISVLSCFILMLLVFFLNNKKDKRFIYSHFHLNSL
jgi:hypothetical protein